MGLINGFQICSGFALIFMATTASFIPSAIIMSVVGTIGIVWGIHDEGKERKWWCVK